MLDNSCQISEDVTDEGLVLFQDSLVACFLLLVVLGHTKAHLQNLLILFHVLVHLSELCFCLETQICQRKKSMDTDTTDHSMQLTNQPKPTCVICFVCTTINEELKNKHVNTNT